MEVDVTPVVAVQSGITDNPLEEQIPVENRELTDPQRCETTTGVIENGNDVTTATETFDAKDRNVSTEDKRRTGHTATTHQVLAYEKIISSRDNEISSLRDVVTELQEKLVIANEATLHRTECPKDDTTCMRQTELDFMHDENARMKVEADKLRQELETQLVCEKGKNLTLSQKLDDAALLSERTMLAYNSQKDLADARLELIESLKKEIDGVKQINKQQLSSNDKPVSTDQDSQSMVTREKIVKITNHYDEKIKLMTEDMESLKTELHEAKSKRKTSDANTDNGKDVPCYKKSVQEVFEFINAHAENGAVVNGFLLWVDIQRGMSPENIWKEQAQKRFLSEEIAEGKDTLWRVCGESVLGKMVKRQGNTKTRSEINDVCEAFKLLSEKDVLPVVLGTSALVAKTPIYNCHPVEGDASEVNHRLKVIEESMNAIIATRNDNLVQQMESEPAQGETENASEVAPPSTDAGPNSASSSHPEPETDGDGFTNVFYKKNKKQQKSTTWRGQLNTIRGTSTGENEQHNIAADIHLVAFGVSKNVSGVQLSNFLAGKGLHVVSCDLLTKFEGARSLAYKVVVKASDLEKAQNPGTWPNRVGIRLFKVFKPKGIHEQRGATNDNTKKQVRSITNSIENPWENRLPGGNPQNGQSNISSLSNYFPTGADSSNKRKKTLPQVWRQGNPPRPGPWNFTPLPYPPLQVNASTSNQPHFSQTFGTQDNQMQSVWCPSNVINGGNY